MESMSFREGVDRMVDRATLAIGLDPDTAKIAQSYYDLGLAEPPGK